MPLFSRRLAAVAAALLLAALAVTLAIPVLAERRVRDRLGALGPVTGLEIDGLGGLGALRGRPEAVAVHLASLDPEAARAGGARLGEVPRLDLRADSVAAGPLALEDLVLRKRDDDVRAGALVRDAGAGGPRVVVQDGAPALEVALGPAAALVGTRTALLPLVVRDGGIFADASALPLGGGGARELFRSSAVTVDALAARATDVGVRVEARARTTG